ncbi:MAG: class I SAM-dependent methyltransferase [Pyrinomonadaceae bacterium]
MSGNILDPMSHPNISSQLQDTFAELTPPVESLQVLRELKASKPMRILEIGVGNGYVSNELAKAGHRVTGMDLFEAPLNTLSPAVERIRFDIERDEVPKELHAEFDVVLALAILEHVHDEAGVLRRISSMLKPAGLIYASTPNINWWPFRIKYMFGKTVDDFHTCDHVKFWNLRAFARIFDQNGFSILRQFTSLGILNPTWPLIQKRSGKGFEIVGKWLFLESVTARPLLGYNQVVLARKK